MNMKEKRSSFSGGIGFVLAAAGSAVGLGNLWRFPYLAARYGGGIFLLVYLILLLTFGFAMMMVEIAIGRKTRQSSITAYAQLDKRFGFLGYIAWLVPLFILPYYCVIGGWVLKYCVVYITGAETAAAADNYFTDFAGGAVSPLIFFLIFLIVTCLIIALGVEKGIERFSRFMMPLLILIIIAIGVYLLTVPGMRDGIRYYLLPDLHSFSFKTVCGAMGQLFYSLSIAMGILVSYGSYVKDDVSLVSSVNRIEIFDTLIAVMAGFIIIPPVYLYMGAEGMSSSGPGLMFITLPKVFIDMPAGRFVAAFFFILVLLAAFTSSISILEATTSMLIDKWHMSRGKAVFTLAVVSIGLGIPASYGFGPLSGVNIAGMDILSFFDYVTNSIMMPIVAFFTCVLVGWVVGTKVIEDEITKNGEVFGRRKIFRVMIRYVCPVLMVVILIFFNLTQFGIIAM